MSLILVQNSIGDFFRKFRGQKTVHDAEIEDTDRLTEMAIIDFFRGCPIYTYSCNYNYNIELTLQNYYNLVYITSFKWA